MNASRVRRTLTSYVRVGLSLAVIAVALVALPAELRRLARLLVSFNAGAFAFLALTAAMISGASASEVRVHSRDNGQGRVRALVGALCAAAVGLAAVAFVLRAASQNRSAYRAELILSAVTVFTSWLVLQSVFALYYARSYYQLAREPTSGDGTGGDRGGVQFAGDELPDYWDFVYFSFTIGTCYATSDMPITSRSLRRAALLQMFVSFLFYTFLVGMVINAIGVLLSP